MHNDFGDHVADEVLAQSEGEAEACPVVSVLENLETIAVELDVTVKVHLVESLHGDLVLSMVLEAVVLVLEGEVVLNRAARVSGLLVLAGGDGGDGDPEGTEDRDRGEDTEEDGRLGAATDLPGQPQRNTDKQTD